MLNKIMYSGGGGIYLSNIIGIFHPILNTVHTFNVNTFNVVALNKNLRRYL